MDAKNPENGSSSREEGDSEEAASLPGENPQQQQSEPSPSGSSEISAEIPTVDYSTTLDNTEDSTETSSSAPSEETETVEDDWKTQKIKAKAEVSFYLFHRLIVSLMISYCICFLD